MTCWRKPSTPSGLVTWYGTVDPNQLWVKEWLIAWRHQVIISRNSVQDLNKYVLNSIRYWWQITSYLLTIYEASTTHTQLILFFYITNTWNLHCMVTKAFCKSFVTKYYDLRYQKLLINLKRPTMEFSFGLCRVGFYHRQPSLSNDIYKPHTGCQRVNHGAKDKRNDGQSNLCEYFLWQPFKIWFF